MQRCVPKPHENTAGHIAACGPEPGPNSNATTTNAQMLLTLKVQPAQQTVH